MPSVTIHNLWHIDWDVNTIGADALKWQNSAHISGEPHHLGDIWKNNCMLVKIKEICTMTAKHSFSLQDNVTFICGHVLTLRLTW